MAENDFLSGLLGGVKDVGGSIYGGISGLLGGGEQAPAGANQMQDSLSMLSPQDQRRLMFSTLGQVGATLLAAGARQSPESRAQALAQLGKVGPAIEESIQRSAALQQQRLAAQRQAELFAPQLAAAKAGAAEKEISLRQQQETLAAQDVVRQLRDKDPEALAKDLGLTAGYVKAMPIADLVEATKQIAIKRATKSPLEAAVEARIAQSFGVQPVAPQAPTVAVPAVEGAVATQAPVAEPAATQAPAQGGVVSMATPTNPEAVRLRALASDPLISAADPKKAKEYAELADKLDPAGSQEAAKKIEVSKAEMRINQPKVEQALAGQMMKSENISKTINRAIDRVGNWSAGYGSLLSYIPETQARNLQADIATIKANLGFAELERMREASPTGGALGQVAVQELNYLQSAIANLDQAQSPGDLKRALGDIRTSMKGYQTLREKAYEKDYGQKFDIKKFAGEGMGAEKEQPTFKSADEVKSAVQSGSLTRDQGLQILRSKFGFE